MPHKILIVDDDLDTLRLVGLLLQRKGYEIIAADNGSAALTKALTERPDLILLDVMMPEMDGIEVLRRLRREPATAPIPTIMFTAKSQISDKVLGFESGADDYLTKPTHPAELVARVRTILARASTVTQAARTTENNGPAGKVTFILGTKGGMGATMLGINLAVAIRAKSGKSCVFMEFRPGQGSAAFMLGMEPGGSFQDILRKTPEAITEEDVRHALVRHQSGLDLLLSSGQPADAHLASADAQLLKVLHHLAVTHQHVIVDAGPGLTDVQGKLAEKSDQVLVLIEPLQPTVEQARALLSELRMKVLGLGTIQLVLLNRAKQLEPMPLRNVQKDLGMSISAVIPPEPELAYDSLAKNIPLNLLHPDCGYSQQIARISDLITQ